MRVFLATMVVVVLSGQAALACKQWSCEVGLNGQRICRCTG